MQTIEERLDQLEKRNKCLTAALAVMAVAICAVVTMAATGEKRGDFDVVTAKHIFVENAAGQIVVYLGTRNEDGLVQTFSAKEGSGKQVVLGSINAHGVITTFQPNGELQVE